MNTLSTFLFARPTFAEGIARLVDLGDTLTEYNSSPSGAQADYLALYADWRCIGLDMQQAMLAQLQSIKEEIARGQSTEQR